MISPKGLVVASDERVSGLAVVVAVLQKKGRYTTTVRYAEQASLASEIRSSRDAAGSSLGSWGTRRPEKASARIERRREPE